MASYGALISHKYGYDTTNTPVVGSGPITDAHYSFEWTSKQTSPGITTVYWKLYGRGRNTSPTQAWNHVKVNMYANDTLVDTCEVSANTSGLADEEYRFNDCLKREGSFTVSHSTSDGSGSFQVAFVDFWAGESYPTYSVTRSATLDSYPMCTVSYNAMGGTPAPSSVKVFKGQTISPLPTISRRGYEFLGWFSSATGGVKYTSYTPTSNATLYAQWKALANLYQKVNGQYKEGATRVKSGGVWKEGQQIFQKKNGSWVLKQ